MKVDTLVQKWQKATATDVKRKPEEKSESIPKKEVK
jgi:hypothetical protein